MISSRSPFFLYLIVPLIITNMNPTRAINLSFHNNYCSNSTFNGTFGKNLNHLFSSFIHSGSSNNSASTGFYSSSYGEIPDKAYAVGYCRGDLKSDDCEACVATSASLILENACDVTEGGVGSINCTLRYSNISISGIRVDIPAVSSYSEDDRLSSPSRFGFSQRVTTLFDGLITKAAAGSDVRKFAVGHSNAQNSSDITIYGLAQCSPDLSESDCGICLGKSLEKLPPCCYKSWEYVGASCSLEYEPYLFYDPATDPTTLPPPSPPPATISNSGGIESSISWMVISSLVPIMVSMLLSSL